MIKPKRRVIKKWEDMREWKELYVNNKHVANVQRDYSTGRIIILAERDPRTGNAWRSMKQAREFLDSLVEDSP
jgi:hypothetical protein